MVGTGCVFQLFVKDIIDEVEGVVDEEQRQGSSQDLKQKTPERQGQERPRGTSDIPVPDVMHVLVALQVELSSEHEQNFSA
ncbi:hypothetical protein MG293_020819 [Ovis ammon polii]|uniref:Uncharacterized protein n=1 Tax=Ovis ammon polii TaxID=230172 RepID=A0AAD4TP96_OVIAM|nr:hypothetical protein MG293_020819 [Ovis ammon polii]